MVWIVTGAHGQLGTALCRLAPDRMHGLTHAELDITNRDQIPMVFDRIQPEGVINTAAYNFVDKAETDRKTAFCINVTGPKLLAMECNDRGLPLVHISTDYVLSGALKRSTGFWETDSLFPGVSETPIDPRGRHPLTTWKEGEPLVQMKIDQIIAGWDDKDDGLKNSRKSSPFLRSTYAITKLCGESVVQEFQRQHFIIRTCGIYGRARTAGKGNFVETMLRLGKERGEVRVVTDQRCTPTSAVDLATGILKLIDTSAYGLYHLTNSGSCSWFEFAAEIFRQAGLSVKMTGITTEEFGAAADRPRFSVLDCRKFIATTGWTPPAWQDALQVYLAERG